MKVAIIYNEDLSGVINQFGMRNKEKYNPGTIKLISEALEQGGHNVRIIDGNMKVVESLHDFMPRVVEGERMGMVFNLAYGIQGESRYTHVPALLEMLGIPYVGSNPEGHALALDKVITKIIMQRHGIPTPEFWVFSNPDDDMNDVTYPVIVKPKMEAVSYGLKVVHNQAELKQAVSFVVDEFKQQALAEQFIRGREFCVGLLGNENLEALPVLEIDLNGDLDAIQTDEDKREKPRKKICPAKISPDIAKEMVKLSKKAFRMLGLRDFARVDIRMDENNNIYLLEINSMASLGSTGSYVKAAQVAGYDYVALVNKMLDVATVRYFSESFIQQEHDRINGKTKSLPLAVRLRGFVRSRQGRTEKLLRQMVNMNTYVRNVEGVNALGSLIVQNLSPLGFTPQIIPQVEVGNILRITNSHEPNFDVLLLGHLDDPIPFKKQKLYRETEQRLYGSGIWMNKSGVASMILAMQALRFTRLLRKMRLAILLTTDNSIGGRFARDLIVQTASKANIIIGLSGGGLDATVVTSRSGAAQYKCQMNLQHAEKAEEVSSAVSSFLKLLMSWVDFSDESKGVIVTARDVDVSSSISDLYAQGEASISVRSNDVLQAEDVKKKIFQSTKKASRGKLKVQIEGDIKRPAMHRSEGVGKLWDRFKTVADNLDFRLIEEHRWSSSNICFVENSKPMIDGIGPLGIDYSGKEEFIVRHSLLERSTLLAMALHSLVREPIV